MLMLRMTAMAVVIFFMAFNVSRLDNAFNYVDENNKRVIDTMQVLQRQHFYVPVYQSIRYCMNYIIPTNRQSI